MDDFSARDPSDLASLLLMDPSTGYDAGVSIYCVLGGRASREDIPNARVSPNGSFAFAGAADLTRGTALSHVRVRLQGLVSYSGRRLRLVSATGATLVVSGSGGCGDYTGSLNLQRRVP
jgi:hypothetical protein